MAAVNAASSSSSGWVSPRGRMGGMGFAHLSKRADVTNDTHGFVHGDMGAPEQLRRSSGVPEASP